MSMDNFQKIFLPNEEELQDYREIFNLVDTDGSGEIDREELSELMRILGLNPKKKDIEIMLKEINVDERGLISFNKFVQIMNEKSCEVDMNFTSKDVKSAFKVFEESDDVKGTVKSNVIEHAFFTYGNDIPDLDEVHKLMNVLDPEKTGHIDYQEHVNRVQGNLV